MTSPKELLWLTCAEKRCCHATVVYPTGADIYRIATTLAVPPWHFTVASPADVSDDNAFALDKSGARYRAALAKAPGSHPEPRPCTFLIRAADDAARCGLGDLRPGPCKSFPSSLVDGEVRLAHGVCSCREWSLADVDQRIEKELLLQELRDRRAYADVVASWNAFVASDECEQFEYADFCRYMLDAYAQLADAAV
jgi:hypothetical protein